MTPERAVIVGASHAGAQLAATLRREGWAGEVVLIGDEGGLPYHRPPLSKGDLAGKNGLDDLLIRGADFYEKQVGIKVSSDCDSFNYCLRAHGSIGTPLEASSNR